MRTKEEIQETISKLNSTIDSAQQAIRDLENELSDLKYKESRLNLIDKLDDRLPGKPEQFKIFTGCRQELDSEDPWTNIIIGDLPTGDIGMISRAERYKNKVTILYPDSVEFDKEFKELLKKYIAKQI